MGELPLVTTPLPTSRAEGTARLSEVLAATGSADEVCVIGSMARPGEADVYSDIDLRWTIPQGQAVERLASLRRTLERVGTVESLRVDPEIRPDQRLVFVRFDGWPLWWRVDLEIHSAGVETMGVADADPWSAHESACMGVVVTLKALARHRPAPVTEELWARALRRVEAPDVAGDWSLRIGSLLDHLQTSGPPTAALVSRTRRLSLDVLGR